jgi:hypothetical protein
MGEGGHAANIESSAWPRLSAHTAAPVLSRMVRGRCSWTLQSHTRVRSEQESRGSQHVAGRQHPTTAAGTGAASVNCPPPPQRRHRRIGPRALAHRRRDAQAPHCRSALPSAARQYEVSPGCDGCTLLAVYIRASIALYKPWPVHRYGHARSRPQLVGAASSWYNRASNHGVSSQALTICLTCLGLITWSSIFSRSGTG